MNDPWVYIVVAGAVIIVIARLLPKPSGPSSEIVKEMEGAIEQFAADLEQDNEKLLLTISRMKDEHNSQLEQLSRRMGELEKQNEILGNQMERLKQEAVPVPSGSQTAGHAHSAAEAPAPPTLEAAAAQEEEAASAIDSGMMNIKARYAELFSLYEQGKSIEAIARKLGMNKGEVNLIVQLGKQEENSHERVRA